MVKKAVVEIEEEIELELATPCMVCAGKGCIVGEVYPGWPPLPRPLECPLCGGSGKARDACTCDILTTCRCR